MEWSNDRPEHAHEGEEAMKHLCHATGCPVETPPRLFMCGRHWGMLPTEMKNDINRLFRPGQEVSKTPSKQYMLAALAAVKWLRKNEVKR